MNEPRCGMKDIVDKVGIQPRRKKRYVLQGSRWRQKTISYRNAILCFILYTLYVVVNFI